MGKIIFTVILIIFPFGQLIKLGQVNLFDILVSLLAIWTIFQKPKYPVWYSYFTSFILFAFFSWLFNFFILNDPLVFKGLLYLVRLVIYSFVGVYVFNLFKKDKEYSKVKESLYKNLIYISTFSAIFGWVQYLFLPDVRFLKSFGWDDHLYRMVGTFFDPTFLALIILLGLIVALHQKSHKLFYFLLISLAFTYSRATYLGLLIYLLLKKKFLAILIFTITVLMLPKMLSEGTDFKRTVSNQNKISNYIETFQIFKKSPAIGVGFNNLCLYKNDINTKSHSCFGSDSSLLLILSTTGVIGFILFLTFLLKIPYSETLLLSFTVVMIHSLFANSLFYPHIMFWLFSLAGLRSVGKVESD